MKTPLYHRIYCDLRSQIETRSLRAGDLLPPEAELERRYGASRSPVRQAMGLLESEGLIVRQPGKGTFVAPLPEEIHLWFHCSPFREHLRREWDRVSCRTLRVEQKVPPQPVQDFLALARNRKAIYLERVRYVADKPVIFTRHYLQPEFDLAQIQEAGDFFSVRAMLMENFSVEITRIEDALVALPSPPDVAARLGVAEHHPLLETRRRSSSGNRPVHFDVFYTRSEFWDYRVAYEKGPGGSAHVVPFAQ